MIRTFHLIFCSQDRR